MGHDSARPHCELEDKLAKCPIHNTDERVRVCAHRAAPAALYCRTTEVDGTRQCPVQPCHDSLGRVYCRVGELDAVQLC